jgi:hypothetical protein
MAGRFDTNFKPDLDRSSMPSNMQLGEHKCPGTCGTTYKVRMSLTNHMNLVTKANEMGIAGRNTCWQPGFLPPPPPAP